MLFRSIREGTSWSGKETNALFLADGAGGFSDISHAASFDFPDDGRALALIDWDADGDLDTISSNRTAPQVRILRNDIPQGNRHSLGIRLIGGEGMNRDAIGARVTVDLENQPPLIRTLRAGEGFQTQNTKWLHFGLGETDEIKVVKVDWPGGKSQTFTGLKVDGRYILNADTSTAVRENRSPVTFAASVVSDARDDIRGRAMTPSKLPFPPLSIANFSKKRLRKTWKKDAGVTYITFWASWCPICQAELKTLDADAQELERLGISLLALSVDGLGTIEGSIEEAKKFAESLNLSFETGMASGEILQKMRILHDLIFEKRGSFPLPTSLIIDSQGQLSGYFEGQLSKKELLKAAKIASQSRTTENLIASLPFPGKWLAAPVEFKLSEYGDKLLKAGNYLEASNLHSRWSKRFSLDPEEANFLTRLGDAHEERGDLRGALRHYTKAVKLKPENPSGWASLASRHITLTQYPEAAECLQTALGLNPKLPEAQFNLGIIHQRTQKFDEALTAFRAELVREPQHVMAQANVAGILLKQRKFPEAASELERLLVIKEDFHEARFQLALIYDQLSQSAAAQKHYQQLSILKPDFPGLRSKLEKNKN